MDTDIPWDTSTTNGDNQCQSTLIGDIPLMGIKGGQYDLQRFIYWNFLKCYWNEDMGVETSDMINFDWYSPSNAKRYSEAEYKALIAENNLEIEYFHSEEACYSGRFRK